MKKAILNEINRTREIMGLKYLILEQSAILKYFMRMLKHGDAVMVALQKTVLKKYGKTAGLVSITKIAKAADMIEVLNKVMEKTSAVFRNNGQLMSKKLRGAGIDITETQAARLGKAWTKGDDAFNAVLKDIAKSSGKITDIKSIFISANKNASEIQRPMIDALEEILGAEVKHIDDLERILKSVEMPTDDVTRIINNINQYGTIGSGKNLDDIFKHLINSPNYQDDIIKALKGSDDYQKLVREGFTQDDLAKMMGRKVDDPIVKSVYNKVIKLTPFEWVVSKGKWALRGMFLTTAGRSIIGYLIFVLGMNMFFDRKWGVWGKKKAAFTGDMYLDVSENPDFVKQFGGYSDSEALEVANTIQRHLKGSMFGPHDPDIVQIYNEMPSILACSQVTWMWENEVPGTQGTLRKTLITRLSTDGPFPRLVMRGLGDITIEEIYDILDTKSWSTSKASTSKQKFKEEVRAMWPAYQLTLKAEGKPWYSRYSGPIDAALLGVLLQKCEGQTQEDCLRKYDAIDFNSAFNALHPNDAPIYTENQQEAVDQTNVFFEDFMSDIENNESEETTYPEKVWNELKRQWEPQE